jgi:glycosyltransferase involved in cell wall biosynthesis
VTATRAPLVSIGMPVYNGGEEMCEAIESIRAQTLADFELIVSDNASTDDTPAIIERYTRSDPRVRYVRIAKNVGVNPNYCHVFRLSRGTYFKWASSNDLLDATFLARCVAELERDPSIALCFSNTGLFTASIADARPYEDNLDLVGSDPVSRFDHVIADMRLNNALNGVVRSSVLRRTALIPDYDPSDVVLIAEIALNGKIRRLEDTLFFRRMSAASATKLKSREELMSTYYVNKSFGTYFPAIRQTGGYLGATVRAPLSVRDRLRMLRRVGRSAYWDLRNVLRGVAGGGDRQR